MKPRNSGGSPSGVSAPPILATRKMKKMITCCLWVRQALARMIGRMSNMAAPVVPTQLASTVPTSNKAVFTMGVPTRRPLSTMPPLMVNRPHKTIMKGM